MTNDIDARIEKLQQQINSAWTDLYRLDKFYDNLYSANLFTEAEVIKKRIIDVAEYLFKLFKKRSEILSIICEDTPIYHYLKANDIRQYLDVHGIYRRYYKNWVDKH